MIVLDRVPTNIEDQAMFNFLQKMYLILKDVPQIQAISVSSTLYTVTSDGTLFLVDASSAPVTVNLPSASGSEKRVITVKKVDGTGNAVTIDASGAETIDGATTQTLSSQYDYYQIISDGTEWFIV